MTRFRISTACLFGVLVAATAVALPAGAGARPLTKCVAPEFHGAFYWQHTLRYTWLRVGPSAGTVLIHRYYGGHCIPVTRRAHRLRGIAPSVAVSLGGSSRVLLIRERICEQPEGRLPDALLVQCLRRESR